MTDQKVEWIQKPGKAWDWGMSWVEYSKTGTHQGVKTIHDAAKSIKDRYSTDGLWSPGAKLVYDMLTEAADMAQDEYESAQPTID